MRNLVALLTGLLFGLGLVISGMTQPAKVVGFLNFFGDWDPSLAFVMGGAVVVNTIIFRLTKKRSRPLLGPKFHMPTKDEIDWRLIAGSALFGVGWGLAGYCPGPGITALVSMQAPALVFVGAMAAGMVLFAVVDRFIFTRPAA